MRPHQAFTVLELMVTLAIAAILLATAVPSFQHFSDRQQMRAAVRGLHNDLRAARAEAIFRNTTVVACPGNPARGCSGGNDWSSGWIVFADGNGDRQRQEAEPIVRHYQAESRRVVILSNGGRTSVRFLADGSAPGSNASIGLCGRGGPAGARKIVISNTGRIRRDTFPAIDPALCP